MSVKEKTVTGQSGIMKAIRYLLDKQIHFLVLGAAVLYLVYSWFTLQVRYAQLQTYELQSTISLSRQDSTIFFFRDNAFQRPLISTASNFYLMSLNDLQSTISVNGKEQQLWDTTHGYNASSADSKFFHAMSRDNWVLYKDITVGVQSKKILVEYYYRNDSGASDVVLQIAHGGTFNELKLGTENFTAVSAPGYYVPKKDESGGTLSGWPPGEPEIVPGQPNTSGTRITVKVNTASLKGIGVKFNSGSEVDEQGRPRFVYAVYNLRGIPMTQRTLIASEEISWEEAK